MGFWQSMKAWFATEAEEAKAAGSELQDRLSSDLDRREQRLSETPADAMERLQNEIAENESAIAGLGDKIDHTGARADAVADVEEEILDLPSEELD